MLKTYFIAQTQHLIDIDRGGNRQFTEPQILGVYCTLDEAKMALDAIGDRYGQVIQVRNPICIEGAFVCLPHRTHEWSFTPPKPKRSRKKSVA